MIPKYLSPLSICPKRDWILCTLSGKPRASMSIPRYATGPEVVMDPRRSVNRQTLDHRGVSHVQFEQFGGIFVSQALTASDILSNPVPQLTNWMAFKTLMQSPVLVISYPGRRLRTPYRYQ